MSRLFTLIISLLIFACQPSDNTQKEQPGEEEALLGQAQAEQILRSYCQSLNDRDFESFIPLFAAQTEQWIGMKNTSPEEIGKAAKSFLDKKPEARYELVSAPVAVDGQKITATMRVQWTNYDAEVAVEIRVDEQLKIKYYTETEILSQIAESGGDGRKEMFGKLLVVKPPYNMGTGEKDTRFYNGTAGESEEMLPFIEDVESLPCNFYAKMQIHQGIWLVFADFGYRFYTEYRLFSYDDKGNKIKEGPVGTDVSFPSVDTDFIIKAHDGEYRIDIEGNFEKLQ